MREQIRAAQAELNAAITALLKLKEQASRGAEVSFGDAEERYYKAQRELGELIARRDRESPLGNPVNPRSRNAPSVEG